MDASTHTAYVLEQQRAADLARERALRASHRERREALAAGSDVRPALRRRSAPSPSPAPATACDVDHLALAGPGA